MRACTAVIERCDDTNLYMGYMPGFPGAHSQGATLDELHVDLQEVIAMLVDEGEPKLETEFSGTQTVRDGAFAVPIARPSKRYLQHRDGRYHLSYG